MGRRTSPRQVKWWHIALLALLAVAIIGSLAGGDSDDTASPSDTVVTGTDSTDSTAPPTTEPPTTTTTVPGFGPGTHRVGADIEAGTYRTPGPSGSICYWARLKDLSGTFGGLIANGTPDGPGLVTIAPTDVAFETSGCQRWERVS